MAFLIIAVIVLAVFTLLYFAAPPYLHKKFINDQRKAAGITVKSIKIPGFNIVYAEGGIGDPIIMLHGFGGSKNDWLQFSKYFTPNYRVILPDLPGFGDSTKLKDEEFGIMFQVEKMHESVCGEEAVLQRTEVLFTDPLVQLVRDHDADGGKSRLVQQGAGLLGEIGEVPAVEPHAREALVAERV